MNSSKRIKKDSEPPSLYSVKNVPFLVIISLFFKTPGLVPASKNYDKYIGLRKTLANGLF